jgi:glutamate synthase (NADPH/NADH) small chain
MGSITGFKDYQRKTESYQDIGLRITNYDEVMTQTHDMEHLHTQSARCMDCGVPFCQSDTGCPVHNLIPEWNDLVYKGNWQEAYRRLAKTNNFPEWTGRVCPAPCEGSCVLGKDNPAVTIKNIEAAIIDTAFENGWVTPRKPQHKTGKKVAIIGSGPAGLAAADELNQKGHSVTVFERDDRIGGLLMYGIPNMKLDKKVVDRRVHLLTEEGIDFITNTELGKDITLSELENDFDAILLATGSTIPRDLSVAGRKSAGIYPAMTYLKDATQSLLNTTDFTINAKDKKVIVIGGGDTGTDCIATATRQGATSIVNFELMDKPPVDRAEHNPWPQWPLILRTDYGHEEAAFKYGNDPRSYNLLTKEFISENGKVIGIKTINAEFKDGKLLEIAGTEQTWEADLVLLSMGFISPEAIQHITTDEKGNYNAEYGVFKTNNPKIFAAGDCRRGQSLVVWAIHEARLASQKIDEFLKNEGK